MLCLGRSPLRAFSALPGYVRLVGTGIRGMTSTDNIVRRDIDRTKGAQGILEHVYTKTKFRHPFYSLSSESRVQRR